MSVCSYQSPIDSKHNCKRERAEGSRYCCFHEPIDSPTRISSENFFRNLETLIDNNDGNWAGFNFPENIVFKKNVFNTPLDLRFSNINDLAFYDCTFKEKVTFSNSKFSGEVTFRSFKFEDGADFSSCIFEENVEFSGNSFKETIFQKCEFKKITSFVGTYKGAVNFSNAIFYDAVTFRGGWTYTLQVQSGISVLSMAPASLSISNPNVQETLGFFEKIENEINNLKKLLKEKYSNFKNKVKREFKHKSNRFKESMKRAWQRVKADNSTKRNPLFHDTVSFSDVDFRCPDRTKFINVDLYKASLMGTDLKGVNLYSVNFWQPILHRKGLYDEVLAIKSPDRTYLKRMLPRLEAGYRNLRVSLEENKDYATAIDFYIGEMEARRCQKPFLQRHLFSIEAVYLILSKYGGSSLRAVLFLVLLICIHSLCTYMLFIDPISDLSKAGFVFIGSPVRNTIDSLIVFLTHSLKVVTLQKGEVLLKIGGFQNTLDAVFRILGPIQVALIALSLRGRIKRH